MPTTSDHDLGKIKQATPRLSAFLQLTPTPSPRVFHDPRWRNFALHSPTPPCFSYTSPPLAESENKHCHSIQDGGMD